MTDTPVEAPITPEVLDTSQGPLVATPAPAIAADVTLPAGVQPSRNYLAAVELGHVLARSGYYRDAIDPAQAAVKVMIGMDLGVSPTAALQAIHTMEDNGKIVFLIEAKLLAAVVKGRPDVEYKILKREDDEVEAEFLRRGVDGEWAVEGPNIKWTIADAKKAVKGFEKKPTWKGIPKVMLTWRVLMEGFRLYFPDVLAGQPIYAMEELDTEPDDLKLRQALDPSPEPLQDRKAEGLREKMRAVYDELCAINPDRLVSGRFAQALASSEHSHAAMEAKIAWLEDLRDTERTLVERKAKLVEAVGEKDAEPIIERAERRGSQREKIEIVEKAIQAAAAEAPAEEKPAESADAATEGDGAGHGD